MKFDVFPENYTRRITEKAEEQISTLNTDFDQKMESIRRIAGQGEKTTGEEFFSGCAFGFSLGFFACFGTCILDLIMSFNQDAPIIEIAVWIIVMLICGFISALGTSGHNKEVSNAREQITHAEDTLKSDIKSINNDMKKRIDSYKNSFDEAAVEESSFFMESNAVSDITKWLLALFENELKKSDNGKHMEYITCSFSFVVTSEDIHVNQNYSKSEYSFEKNRLESLDLIRVAGLAKAVETSLQLQINMNYLAKADGDLEMSITENRTEVPLQVAAKIFVQMKNPKYEEVKGW